MSIYRNVYASFFSLSCPFKPDCAWSFCTGPNHLGVRLEMNRSSRWYAIKEKKNDTLHEPHAACTLSHPADRLYFLLFFLLIVFVSCNCWCFICKGFFSNFQKKKRKKTRTTYANIKFNICLFIFLKTAQKTHTLNTLACTLSSNAVSMKKDQRTESVYELHSFTYQIYVVPL